MLDFDFMLIKNYELVHFWGSTQILDEHRRWCIVRTRTKSLCLLSGSCLQPTVFGSKYKLFSDIPTFILTTLRRKIKIFLGIRETRAFCDEWNNSCGPRFAQRMLVCTKVFPSVFFAWVWFHHRLNGVSVNKLHQERWKRVAKHFSVLWFENQLAP